ncbi:MAG: hypothetical protein U9Q07_05450 [Planctomycetota bacterium]|nr:hypothetical protein [Planctomycetota bacterium]
MSWLSSAINKVLPGAPATKVTKATFDKWIAPEHKDTLELMGSMALGPAALANLPGGVGAFLASPAGQNVAKGLSSWGATGNVKGAIIAGMAPLLGNLPGDLGEFFKTNIGQSVIQSGNTSILDKLGFSGKQKDIVEQALALMALAALGTKYAEEAIERANKLEKLEVAAVEDMLARADEIYPTPERERMEFEAAAEDISNAYARSGKMLLRTLAQRGALRTGVGAGQLRRLGQDEAGERLKVKRAITLAHPQRVLAAQQAKAAALSPLSNAARFWREIAEGQRMMPIDIAMELYRANQPSALDDYYRAQINLMNRGETGGYQPGAVLDEIPRSTWPYSGLPQRETVYDIPLEPGAVLDEIPRSTWPGHETNLPGLGFPSLEERYPVPELDINLRRPVARRPLTLRDSFRRPTMLG